MHSIKTMVFAPTKTVAIARFWERMKNDGYTSDDLKIVRVAHKRNWMLGAADLWEIYYRRREK